MGQPTLVHSGRALRRARIVSLLVTSFLAGVVSGLTIFRLWVYLRRRPTVGRVDTKRRIICVMGSGSDEERKLADALGSWIARSGFHLLTGGGHGVMTSVSRAFARERDAAGGNGGLVLAVLPGLPAARASDWASAREQVTSKLLVDQSSGVLQYSVVLDSSSHTDPEEAIVAPAGYPNKFVDIAIRTHLPSSGGAGQSTLSRNHINVLSADVVVALPGGAGTASEVALALRYGVPVCSYLGEQGTITGLAAEADAIPVFTDLASTQAFVLDAVKRPRKVPAPVLQMSRRASSGAGLDLDG